MYVVWLQLQLPVGVEHADAHLLRNTGLQLPDALHTLAPLRAFCYVCLLQVPASHFVISFVLTDMQAWQHSSCCSHNCACCRPFSSCFETTVAVYPPVHQPTQQSAVLLPIDTSHCCRTLLLPTRVYCQRGSKVMGEEAPTVTRG